MAKLLRKYSKKSKYSLCFGVYPTLELLEHRPELVQSIYLRSDAIKNGGAQKIKEICAKRHLPYHINNKTILAATGKENIYALAIFEKFENPILPDTNHVMLINPSGAGNLGTILRTMDAFNFHDIAIIKPGVDIFHPEVVRSAMGSLFTTRFQYFENLDQYKELHTHSLYFFTGHGNTPLMKVSLKQPYALVFGNEGEGIPSNYLIEGITVRIPQSDNVDSLNLATAVGITLYTAYSS